jgi:PAS domain S-box-containing protein
MTWRKRGAQDNGDSTVESQAQSEPEPALPSRRELEERNRALSARVKELEAAGNRFRDLAENVPAAFAWVDSEQRYVFANKAHEALLGVATETILGQRVETVVGTAAYDTARPHIAQALSGKEASFERSARIRGAKTWVRTTLVPRFDAHGLVTGFFALSVDLTKEKDYAEAIHDSRDRLASVLDTAAEAIVTIDENGSIASFNPAAQRMFGYTEAEAIGRNVRILMPEPYRSEHDGYIKRYLETGETKIIGRGREVTARHKDGSIFPADLAVSKIDHQRRFTGIIRDVTDRKKAQEALRKSRQELRDLSARLLTAEDAERRRISRELHDDLNQRIAMISVDLDRLLQEEGSRDMEPSLRGLHDSVTRLSEDVRSLAYRLHPAILDDLGLSAAVRSLIADFAEHYDIAVSLRERRFPKRLSTELSSCFYRVVQESLANVARHSRSARVAIRLVGSLRALRLSIRDYGVGFDVQEARNHRRTLGIVSMEERVRMSGGHFSIWSSSERGTRIRVTVPLESTRN